MPKRRILVPFDPEQLERIEAFRRRHRLPTRVAAIRALIDAGAANQDPLARALRALQASKAELERRGVARIGVFGSLARGEADVASDVDVLVLFAPSRVPDLFGFLRLRDDIGGIIRKATGREAEIVEAESLRPRIRRAAEADAVYAF
ncbi:MAG: nucleotidyltransferase domain-containing protein [Proteobacteria bacterium]|nr:nucleotidyltransferase domain-containing protein [Pseudomonadota bacterium]MBI3497320.1 nucleotidyltransferase domain-containing protein [Pseudomonadota bacterium]